jgi:hypothetical protein
MAAGSISAWAQHNAPPSTTTLPGGAGHLTYSIETTKGAGSAGVDCPLPANAPNNAECYTAYDNSKKGSGGDAKYVLLQEFTGPGAPVLGGISADPLTFGGVWTNNAGAPSGNGRAWTGLKINGVGSLSVAAGGGAADSSGHPNGCVTVFAADGTSGAQIAHALATAGISDNANDTETDGQLCGVIGG